MAKNAEPGAASLFDFSQTVGTLEASEWIALVSAIGALVSLIYARGVAKRAKESDRRAKQLFSAQVRPLIQTRPVSIEPYLGPKKEPMMRTMAEVINFSGFDAYGLSLDFKYGRNSWISQWIIAMVDALEKKGEQRTPEEEELYKHYSTKPQRFDLRAGEGILITTQGSGDVDAIWKSGKELEVRVRTIWKNERRYTFDRVRAHKLVCTSAPGGGRHFDFIPEPTLSGDDWM